MKKILIGLLFLFSLFILILFYQKKPVVRPTLFSPPTPTLNPTPTSGFSKKIFSVSPTLFPCQSTEITSYPVIKTLSADLNQDSRSELIRFYGQNECHSEKPIVIKIFDGKEDCYQEKFLYPPDFQIETKTPINFGSGKYNQLDNVEIIDDFFGDGKRVLLALLRLNFCGSGSESQLLVFLNHQGAYQKIAGPILNENDFYILYSHPKGKFILVGRAIWGEGEAHFEPHRYQIFLYHQSGLKYLVEFLGTTRNKYTLGDDKYLIFYQQLEKTFHQQPDELKKEIGLRF
jgi:hypothetical protein